ncbi:N-methyl-L-tryptophan oxidase [Schlesneria paludicola]|uniref:N-methyl-L-tryptophan oxidase n=1 Tax=Schlesneria paludicola TaxID=360056 RepID=UPI00029A16DA|nr:N-methyl-L-tryptophan oxidase [Schlesneria paludicola]
MQAANRSEFDTIVLGVGGMGSAACFELARRGQRVLGLEQFSLVHDHGSSHGESRIIRKAYFEHPDYVPLLHRAYERWHALEHATGQELFSPTGLVLSGPPDGETIQGARHSANLHGLDLIDLTPAEACQRFPGMQFPADHAVAFEPGAGTLFVEQCVRAHLDEAVRHGAVLHEQEQVLNWSSDGQTIRVRTSVGEYRANHLVITAGAWANECLVDVGVALTVLRKFVGWFPIQRAGEYSAATGTPTYFFELGQHTFYGFPSFDGTSLKMAEHSGGEPVADRSRVDRECHPADLDRLQSFLSAQLPGIGLKPVKHSACLYTMTSDQHFVVDRHPRWKNVAFAAGFSGHGFKFCSVIGEILADLVTEGRASLPIEFLSLARPGLEFRPK